jgi:hypothetical protein
MMKFVVELRLSPDARGGIADAFSRWHPERDPGVLVRGARIAIENNVIFVVCETEDERRIATACRNWGAHGSYRVHPVSDAQ